MSQLQTFTSRTVASSGAPAQNELNVQYSPDAFGAAVGRALSRVGGQIDEVAQIQHQKDKEKKAADALTIKAKADDELRPYLFDSTSGVYSQLGGSAMGATKRATDKLSEIRKQYIDSVEDPETRTVLSRLWTQEETATKDTVARHEMDQLGTYKDETVKGITLGALQDAYYYYNNDEMQNKAIDQTYRAIDANSIGKPPELVAAAKREALSGIRLAALSRQVQEDPVKALDYYKTHSKEMWGKDLVTANSMVSAASEMQKAESYVAQITGSGATSNRLWSSMEQAESSGNTNAESPKGALGIMQVTPDTAREQATLLGMPDVAALDDAALETELKSNTVLNQTLGRAYLQRQLVNYNGDLEAALVAYNAGPKWADEFLRVNAGKQPGQRDYNIPGNPKLVSETKPYVAKVLGGAGVATGGVVAGGRMTADNWTLKNFRPEDLTAPTGGGNWVDATAAQGLDAATDQIKRMFPDLVVKVNEERSADGTTAGRRRGTADPADNPHVGKSQHLQGRAFDVQVQGWTDEQKTAFLMAARQQGFRGFGFYEGTTGHLHIDMGRERTWGAMPAWAKGAMAVAIKDLPSEPTVYRFTNDPGAAPNGEEDTVASALGSVTAPDGGSSRGAFASHKSPDLPAWLEQANAIVDPSQRQLVRSLLTNQAAQQTAQEQKETEQLKQNAWGMVLQGTTADVPMAMQARLGPEFMNSMYSFEKNRTSNSFPQNDKAWYNFNQLTPEELARTDVYTEFRPQLDNEHWDKAIALKQAAVAKLEGRQYDASAMANQRSRSQIVSDIGRLQGWKNDSESIATFNIKFGERIDAAESQLPAGQRLGEKEMQDIADKLLLNDQSKYFKAFGFETKDPNSFMAADAWGEVDPDDQSVLINAYKKRWGTDPDNGKALDLYNRAISVFLGGTPQIPEDDKQALTEALQGHFGRAVTDEEVTNAYGRYLLELLGRRGPR